MTHRDPPPTLACPACGGSEVQPSTHSTLGRWECLGCWTWFNGGQDEWAKWAEHRSMRAKRQEVASGDVVQGG